MLPIVGAIISTLITNNLPKVAQAVADKGLDYVQGRLGLELKPEMTPEEIARVAAEAAHHEEFMVTASNANTADARAMNSSIQSSAEASGLAKNAAYIIDFVIVGSTIGLCTLLMLQGVPTENKELALMALGSLITLCGTVVNFHRGSSQGSKDKNNLFKEPAK